MANKKLKVEVELETAKAKRQAKGLENLGSSGDAGVSPATDKLAKNLDRAADAAGKLDRSSLSLVRSFTGIGVGLAANYAASHMKQGAARDTVEYGAAAASGAGMGMMAGGRFGPWGAVIGALVGGGGGLLKTYLDKSGEKEKYTEDWKKSEHDYANSKQFADFFRDLTDMSDKTKSFADRISEAEQQLQKYKDVEKTMVENIEKMISQGRYDDANAQRGYLATNRQRQSQLEAAIKGMEKQTKTGGVAFYGASDALAKVGGGAGRPSSTSSTSSTASTSSTSSTSLGGSFFFSGGPAKKIDTTFFTQGDQTMKQANDTIARLEKDGNELLRQIAENTRRREAPTWQ